MNDEERTTPPAQKHSKSEIVAAVKQVQESLEIPAVASREVARLLEYDNDYTTQKLNDLVDEDLLSGYRTGAGFIYWVPENGEGGEIDTSILFPKIVDWDSIGPDDVPEEKAQEIAEYVAPGIGNQTTWHETYASGQRAIEAGGVLFGLGLGGFLIDSAIVSDISLPEFLLTVAVLLLLFWEYIHFRRCDLPGVRILVDQGVRAREDFRPNSWIVQFQ